MYTYIRRILLSTGGLKLGVGACFFFYIKRRAPQCNKVTTCAQWTTIKILNGFDLTTEVGIDYAMQDHRVGAREL